MFWIIDNDCTWLMIYLSENASETNWTGVLHQLPATSGHFKSKQQTFTLISQWNQQCFLFPLHPPCPPVRYNIGQISCWCTWGKVVTELIPSIGAISSHVTHFVFWHTLNLGTLKFCRGTFHCNIKIGDSQYEFPFGIDIVQFYFTFFFIFITVVTWRYG